MSEETKIDDGGQAFPVIETQMAEHWGHNIKGCRNGMTLRDYFAANIQEDDRLVKCIRSMDDKALEFFARFPHAEREEHIIEMEDGAYTDYASIPTQIGKITRRLEIEAHAIARVRYMQADAMLKARGDTA